MTNPFDPIIERLDRIENLILEKSSKQNDHSFINQPDIGGMKVAIEITGLSRASIYRLTSSREIPHSKRGNKLYFSRSELTQWINDGRKLTSYEEKKKVDKYLSKTGKE